MRAANSIGRNRRSDAQRMVTPGAYSESRWREASNHRGDRASLSVGSENHSAGKQVVLVSSGAIGLGRGWVGLHRSRLDDLVTKQACAAVGQGLLMNAYKEMFSAWHIKIAQVLLTSEDFSNWRRYRNLRRTMEKLLTLKVLPVVNENDTVSTAEIESLGEGGRKAAFSDNDRLAALVM